MKSVYHMPEYMYKHSLFFDASDVASQAEDTVRRLLSSIWIEDLDMIEDNDEYPSFEVRFYTSDKLDYYDQCMLVNAVQPSSYALNVEDC